MSHRPPEQLRFPVSVRGLELKDNVAVVTGLGGTEHLWGKAGMSPQQREADPGGDHPLPPGGEGEGRGSLPASPFLGQAVLNIKIIHLQKSERVG